MRLVMLWRPRLIPPLKEQGRVTGRMKRLFWQRAAGESSLLVSSLPSAVFLLLVSMRRRHNNLPTFFIINSDSGCVFSSPYVWSVGIRGHMGHMIDRYVVVARRLSRK